MEKELMIQSLKGIVGEDSVITDLEGVRLAGKDYIGFRRYQRDAGSFTAPLAACSVKVKSAEQASEVLKFLNENKIDVVPRTGGSSVTKGLEPVEGGVILDGSEMDALIEINEYDMIVTAQCGMPLERLEEILNEKGYTTGHYPQSLPMASLGGLVSTRSIGQFSTLYGGIEDLLVGVEAVLADGSIVKIKNVPRRSAGPDLRHMFIGNEGMLGFVTEVSMKLFKYNPENRWMKAFLVDSMDEGLSFIHDIMKEGYKPAVIRLHDPIEVQHILKLDAPEGSAVVLFICEGPKLIAESTGAGIMEIAKNYNVTDCGPKMVEHWLQIRNKGCKDVTTPVHYNMGICADTTEISANWSEIGNIYHAVLDRAYKEIESLIMMGGHSSHSYVQGTNIYFQFLFEGRNDPVHVETEYMKIINIIMEETLKRGGSIAHHHGSGKYRTKWMPEEHGSSYQLMYRLKDALDPNRILNKGVILVEE